MAFYPDVVPGTTFVPIASLENQVRRNINALNGIGGSAIKDKSLSTVRIRVYNNTELTLPAGTAVGFILSSALVGDAVPAEAVKDISKPWGVLADSLKPNDIGDCIISGPVTVDCTGTGAFAEPDVSTPSVFKLGGSGAPVLFSADGRAMINLGASSGEGGGGKEKAFAIITSVPSFGYGQGVAVEANITATGEVVQVGSPYPVLIPKIYRDNS